MVCERVCVCVCVSSRAGSLGWELLKKVGAVYWYETQNFSPPFRFARRGRICLCVLFFFWIQFLLGHDGRSGLQLPVFSRFLSYHSNSPFLPFGRDEIGILSTFEQLLPIGVRITSFFLLQPPFGFLILFHSMQIAARAKTQSTPVPAGSLHRHHYFNLMKGKSTPLHLFLTIFMKPLQRIKITRRVRYTLENGYGTFRHLMRERLGNLDGTGRKQKKNTRGIELNNKVEWYKIQQPIQKRGVLYGTSIEFRIFPVSLLVLSIST